jgi:uncharacterized protein YdhG (YjbR/CyaY superfamily)
MGDVTDYLHGLDGENRAALEHVISLAREIAPDASEGTSYAMPALLHRGKGLVAALETKRHLAIYPFSGQVLPRFADELDAGGFDWAPGTLRFSAEHPVPDALLRRILAARVAEIDEKLDEKRR